MTREEEDAAVRRLMPAALRVARRLASGGGSAADAGDLEGQALLVLVLAVRDFRPGRAAGAGAMRRYVMWRVGNGLADYLRGNGILTRRHYEQIRAGELPRRPPRRGAGR